MYKYKAVCPLCARPSIAFWAALLGIALSRAITSGMQDFMLKLYSSTKYCDGAGISTKYSTTIRIITRIKKK